MPRPPLPLLALLAATAAHAAPCPTGSATGAFLAPGDRGVAHVTQTFVDGSRTTPAHGDLPELPQRTLVVEIWYPTATPASMAGTPPVATGRFPLVVNAPGYKDGRLGEQYLATALASRGYVVASIDFPLTNGAAPGGAWIVDVHNQPADVRFVVDQVLRAAHTKSSFLYRRIDRGKIGIEGLSLGGLTTLLSAYHPHLRDRRFKAAVTLAAYGCPLPSKYLAKGPPLLLLQGTGDRITPAEQNGERIFGRARVPRELVLLAGATHTAFAGAIGFKSQANYDTIIGCVAVEDVTQELFDSALAAFGPDGVGIDTTGCTLPCSEPEPALPVMQARRQHELTQAATVAFFESRFRRTRAARCFLREGLARENADVTTQVAP